MHQPRRGRGAAPVAVLLAVAVVVGGWIAARTTPGEPGPASLLPPLLAITIALATKRIFLSLGTAVVAGGFLSLPARPPGAAAAVLRGSGVEFLWRSAADPDKLLILLYVALIMVMIAVMLAGGGVQAMASGLARVARSARAARVATFLAGLVVFLDDYANTMIVGATMRPIADRHRMSREKLAFLVDATAAPVAGIAILSTWIGVEVGLLGDAAAQLGFQRDGYAVFFDALPFRFYCLTMLAFVGMNAVSGVDFGPMRRAEQRAARLGQLLDDDAQPMVSRSLTAAEPHPAARRRAWTAVVPMVVLLGVFLGGLWLTDEGVSLAVADPTVLLSLDGWRAVLTAADSIPLLALASAEGLGVALILAILVARLPIGAAVRALGIGLRAAATPIAVLLLAWSLQAACDELKTGHFLADLLAERISPATFPALVFVVAGVASFATGTSWGTMSILIPTALPVAFRLDGGVYGPVTIVSAAAVLDGAIFGDHCSPISDTTIMSSAASACDHLAHVRTQLPYSVAVALIALGAGYLPAGLGAAPWTGLLGGAVLAALPLAAARLARGRQ